MDRKRAHENKAPYNETRVQPLVTRHTRAPDERSSCFQGSKLMLLLIRLCGSVSPSAREARESPACMGGCSNVGTGTSSRTSWEAEPVPGEASSPSPSAPPLQAWRGGRGVRAPGLPGNAPGGRLVPRFIIPGGGPCGAVSGSSPSASFFCAIRLRSSRVKSRRRSARTATSGWVRVSRTSAAGYSVVGWGSMGWKSRGSRMRSRRRRRAFPARASGGLGSVGEDVGFGGVEGRRRRSAIPGSSGPRPCSGIAPSPRSTFHTVSCRSGLPTQHGQPVSQGQARMASSTAGRISGSRCEGLLGEAQPERVALVDEDGVPRRVGAADGMGEVEPCRRS